MKEFGPKISAKLKKESPDGKTQRGAVASEVAKKWRAASEKTRQEWNKKAQK